MAPQSSKAEGADSYVPFSQRFKAWWNGVEPDAVVREADSPADIAPTEILARPSEETSAWPSARRAFSQKLWGPGFVDPGGRDFTVHLLKPCALGPEHTVLDLTTGLSGGAQAASDMFGIWLDAMEPDPDLAKAAHAACEQKGYGKRVKVSGLDPSAMGLKKKRYDCIFVRERFHTFNDKPGVLRQIRDALKPKGQLVLTDFIQTTPEPGPATEKWLGLSGDDQPILPIEDYQALFDAAKLQTMIFEEYTAEYRTRVLDGWSELVENLDKSEFTREFVDVLMEEAARWLALTRAMEAGEVGYLRVHAMRPKFIK